MLNFFKKKPRVTIELLPDGNYDIRHTIRGETDQQIIQNFIHNMCNGMLGHAILKNLAYKPELNEFCKQLYEELHPPQVVNIGPVIKPSQAIPNFVNQIKNLLNP